MDFLTSSFQLVLLNLEPWKQDREAEKKTELLTH